MALDALDDVGLIQDVFNQFKACGNIILLAKIEVSCISIVKRDPFLSMKKLRVFNSLRIKFKTVDNGSSMLFEEVSAIPTALSDVQNRLRGNKLGGEQIARKVLL